MLTKKLQEAAGNASNPVYVEEVFSTYLYTGDGNNRSITNNIDVSTKGGLVWVKDRTNGTYGHMLYDTARGKSNGFLHTNTTEAQYGAQYGLTAFNTDGFSIDGNSEVNQNSSHNYASWTFRKQPKFFDVVTYTGDGNSGRTVAHSLGSKPGFIVVKRTSGASQWYCYHQALGVGSNKSLWLNETYSVTDISVDYWNNTEPTATEFTLGGAGVNGVNASGSEYVAYLFAHDAGGFGLTGTDNVISCGTYAGNSSGVEVNLGYEAQWVMVKCINSTGTNWGIYDVMRGMPVWASGNQSMVLQPNTSAAEASQLIFYPTATGFKIPDVSADVNSTGNTYIYIAIRKGPMKVPTDATKVFKPDANTSNPSTYVYSNGFNTDFVMASYRTYGGPFYTGSRLQGNNARVSSSATDAEYTASQAWKFDAPSNTFQQVVIGGGGADIVTHMMQRAPGFMDVVCYTGNGTTQNLTHNLGAIPGLIFVKRRGASTGSWLVWSTTLSSYSSVSPTYYGMLNSTAAFYGAGYGNETVWGNNTNTVDPTSSVFTVGSASPGVNASGSTYVAYLFASCPGVSKVGSYTGNGSSQTINCGFTGGARYIMIKRTDSTGNWYVWDTARGIVSGNDPHLNLNNNDAEVTDDDTIDPASSGFIVNQVTATNVNVSSATYIYLAIA